METEEKAAGTEKKKCRWYDFFLITVVLAFVLLIVSMFTGSFVSAAVPASTDFEITAKSYYALNIAVIITILLFCLIFKTERPILKTFAGGLRGNRISMLLLGLLVGFAMNGACVLAAWLNKDIYLSPGVFEPLKLFLLLLAVFVQSSAEELLCRGFMYQRLSRAYNSPLVPILVNSLFFGALHLMNPGITARSFLNVFTVGVLFSLVVYYFDSLWMAMAIHTAWNFTQNILFGLPNSGVVMPYSLFKLDAANARNSFVYNTGFGIEGTGFSLIVLLAAIGLVIYLGRRKRARERAQTV